MESGFKLIWGSLLPSSRGPVVKVERSLATLLFTDIVGSTERAAELRDAAWRGDPDPALALGRRRRGRRSCGSKVPGEDDVIRHRHAEPPALESGAGKEASP